VGPRGGTEGEQQRWVQIDPIPDSGPPGSNRGLSPVARVAQILEVAREILEPEQLAAIRLRLEDLDFATIAERLGLEGPKAAQDLIRAAHFRLREHYAEERQT
jgi:hypothetical protein